MRKLFRCWHELIPEFRGHLSPPGYQLAPQNIEQLVRGRSRDGDLRVTSGAHEPENREREGCALPDPYPVTDFTYLEFFILFKTIEDLQSPDY